MAYDTLLSFERRLRELERRFGDEAVKDLLVELGKKAKDDAQRGYESDLGTDHKMRNFPRRGSAIELDARFDIVSNHEVAVTPGKRSRGAIKMLEEGRTPRAAGDRYITQILGAGSVLEGPRVKRRTAKRTVGPMAPKHTWSDAVRVIQREAPPRIRRWEQEQLGKTFGG